MTEESHVGAPAKIPALLASGAGLLLSILAALWLRSGQERSWAEEVRKLAEDRAEIIRGQLMRSMEVLHAVGAFFTAPERNHPRGVPRLHGASAGPPTRTA